MRKIKVIAFILALILGLILANVIPFGKVFAGSIKVSFWSDIKGNGQLKSEKRSVAGFDSVDVGGIFKVEIIAGKNFDVEVVADENLLPYIETDVKNNVLRIKTREKISSKNPLLIKVSAPDLKSLDASGVARVSLVNVNNESLDVDVSGASTVDIEGTTRNATIDVSGASRLNAEKLQTENANIDASGASNININVSNELSADLSGASSVRYSGSPRSVKKDLSGASSVRGN